jgi:hypothetical protein
MVLTFSIPTVREDMLIYFRGGMTLLLHTGALVTDHQCASLQKQMQLQMLPQHSIHKPQLSDKSWHSGHTLCCAAATNPAHIPTHPSASSASTIISLLLHTFFRWHLFFMLI